ncbi:MAG: hypothetical protein N2645_06435 [Clostridia bacterium]|nr:hypothetical protein [Clostridia bacterium]
MKYIAILFLLTVSVHPLSYAKYNWGKKNKLAAVGSILLAIAAVIFPSVLLLLR